jgi:hypothetical protein
MVMEHVVSSKGAFEMNEDQSCILGIPKMYFIWGEILKVSRILCPLDQLNLHHHF